MKKIFLTLTVLGLNCLAYAAPSVEKVFDKESSNNENCKVDKLFGCFAQTITQYENSNGEYVRSVAGPRVAAPCASGQIDGSTTTTYVHQLDPYADLWP
ncbi:hypothetical protein [Chryseobacterium sp. SL1]|uniref:hypothetical protein n=1 Tax=Chryseobacterium sp. SL1 TaxID=2995159 RepID=UPI0022742FF0|nr:hypothetical protein [Chryseobacterium sp. SL1]MCY1661026.1 hypothetical protein [Chryseobacterium sp. SL1]